MGDAGVGEVIDTLLARRAVCDQWPEGVGKTAALLAIDEIIEDIKEKGAASKWFAE